MLKATMTLRFYVTYHLFSRIQKSLLFLFLSLFLPLSFLSFPILSSLTPPTFIEPSTKLDPGNTKQTKLLFLTFISSQIQDRLSDTLIDNYSVITVIENMFKVHRTTDERTVGYSWKSWDGARDGWTELILSALGGLGLFLVDKREKGSVGNDHIIKALLLKL